MPATSRYQQVRRVPGLWHDGTMPHLVAPVVPAGRMSSRPQPLLRGERLLFRPWSEQDVDVVIRACADEAIRRWRARAVESADEAIDLISGWRRGWVAESSARWAVVDIARDDVVAQAALRSIDFQEGEADVSYWVVPQARNSGVATDSLRTLAQWSFDELGLHRLELHHLVLNGASCRVAAKAGFRLEGTMQEKPIHADGRHHMHLHARLRQGARHDAKAPCPSSS